MIYNKQIFQLPFPHVVTTHFHNTLLLLVWNENEVILLHFLLLLFLSIFKLWQGENTFLNDFIEILSHHFKL